MSGQNAGLTQTIKVAVGLSVNEALEPYRDVLEFAKREKIRREVQQEELAGAVTIDKLIDGRQARRRAWILAAWTIIVGLASIWGSTIASRLLH